MKLDGGVLYTQIEDQFPQFIQYDHPKFVKFVEKYYEFLETNLITFTDLDLNEYKIIQESDNVTYTVSIQLGENAYGNGTHKFYLNDDVSPTITLNTGTTYIFDMSSETFDGTHYFEFSTTPDGIHTAGGEILTENIHVDGTPGTAGAQTVFYISPDLAGQNLYYFCNTHSGMGGNIVVSNSTPFISIENGNTISSNTSTDYIDLENPNRQGEQFLSGEVVKGETTGARAVVRGKYSNNQIYVHETNNGNFQVGETIVGQTSRVSANVSSWVRQPGQASRNALSFQDVDLAPQGFLELFRKEFLTNIPTTMLADKALVLKNIKDFYRAKGNEESFRFIFRILFGNENVNFYYPSNDVMRLSDGRWTLDKSIKISSLSANNVDSFVGRVIVGQTSNVYAIVERVENYQIGATPITELFLSNIDANNAVNSTATNSKYTTFAVNETVITTTADNDGHYAEGAITGILSNVTIDAGGSNYSVGDDIIVSGGGGQEGSVKVSAVSDATISSFDIIDSGDGYAVGDSVTFVNEGTGGTGGSARVQSIIPTKSILTSEQIINTFKDDQIGAASYTTPWSAYNGNTHLYSNVSTTFTASFTGTAPKKGDFIALFSGAESISNYTPNTSVFGTVIEVDGSAVTYTVGSVYYDSVGDETVSNFTDGDEVTVFDLTKDSNGDSKNVSGNNAVFYSTGSTFTLSNTPDPQTSNTYYGVLTMTGTEIGAIRSIQVLSSGQGYVLIPQVSVANNIVESYGGAVEKTGANSVFVTLNSAIANQFTGNTVIKNDDNTANGVVLDFIDSNTSLVSTGNTVLRVQMNTTQNFTAGERLTAYVNEAGGSAIGIGDFFTSNISTSSTTATLTSADHGLTEGQKITISGVSTGVTGDDNIYNNVHPITSVTNTSTFTITLDSAPTTASVTNALTRRIVTANTAASNAVYANTGTPGNNAVISISSIAIGAIQAVTIYNFGANYTSVPSLDASQSGDGNATLTAEIGSLAEYAGYFNGNYGLLSTTNKVQDNFYYQDFSYVIKTDVDVNSYRDTILQLVHPAGMALFGEIAITSELATKLFANSARDENDTVTSVTHGIQVPQYRFHNVTITNRDTRSSNVQSNLTSSLTRLEFSPAQADVNIIDATVESPSTDFNLILEHGSVDAIALEGFEDIFVFEVNGEILLEGSLEGKLLNEDDSYLAFEDNTTEPIKMMQEKDDPSYFLSESYYDIILQEDGNSVIAQENEEGYRRSFVLFEEGDGLINILSEDPHDVFRIQMENNTDEFVMKMEPNAGSIGEYGDVIITENDERIIGEESNYTTHLLMSLERSEYVTDRVKVEETLPYGFSLPVIKFPIAETGSVKIDFGPAYDVLLENGDYLLLEESMGLSPKYIAYENSMQEEIDTYYEIDLHLGRANNQILGRADNGDISSMSTNIFRRGSGSLYISGAEEFELLAENGDRFVTETTQTEGFLTTENENLYSVEHDGSSHLLAIGGIFNVSGAALITADYGRENEVIGIDTQFEEDFKSIIVLEDEIGTIILESQTSQDSIIVLEGDFNYSSYGIELETNTGIGHLSLEGQLDTTTSRLIYDEYQDLVLEDVNLELEEMSNILFEDYLITPNLDTLVSESGDTLVFEQNTNNHYGSQTIGFGIETVIAEGYTIENAIASVGLESDSNLGESGGEIILEDYTPNDNIRLVAENGLALSDESATDDRPSHFLSENFYLRSWSEGEVVQSGTAIDLIGSNFPHGVSEYGQFIYANGFSTPITSVSTDNRRLIVENSASITSNQTYRVEYGRHETIGGNVGFAQKRVLKAELCSTEFSTDPYFFNDASRWYWYTINGFVNPDTGGTLTIKGLLERHGNDIVYEDGERILIEDGSLRQDDNAILLEFSDIIVQESSVGDNLDAILDEEGGYIVLEDLIQSYSPNKIAYEESDNLLLEDILYNGNVRLRDGERFKVKDIANNTSMTLTSTEATHTPISNASFLIERTYGITS